MLGTVLSFYPYCFPTNLFVSRKIIPRRYCGHIVMQAEVQSSSRIFAIVDFDPCSLSFQGKKKNSRKGIRLPTSSINGPIQGLLQSYR